MEITKISAATFGGSARAPTSRTATRKNRCLGGELEKRYALLLSIP